MTLSYLSIIFLMLWPKTHNLSTEEQEFNKRMKEIFQEKASKNITMFLEDSKFFDVLLSNCQFNHPFKAEIVLPQVHKLQIRGSYVTWQRLFEITRMFPDLESLYVNCWRYRDPQLQETEPILKWRSLGHRFRQLSLIDCFFNNSSILEIVRQLPSLQLLDISNNTHVSSEIFLDIPLIAGRLKTFRAKNLMMGEKGNLSDLSSMTDLQELGIGYKKQYYNVVDWTIDKFFRFDKESLSRRFYEQTRFKNLVELDISTSCSNLIPLAYFRTLKRITITTQLKILLVSLHKIIVNNLNLVSIIFTHTSNVYEGDFNTILAGYKKRVGRRGLKLMFRGLEIK